MRYSGSCERERLGRDLPPDFCGWSTPHGRFIRWRDNGVWERLFEILIDEPVLRG